MLRQYQQDAVSAVLSFLRTEQGNPLIVAPTGSGKSWKIAYLCKEVFERYGKLKILILAHRKELLEQNAEKLLTAWPDAPLGIYSAGLKSREVADITIAGIQSAFRVPEKFGKVNLVICDEVHLVPKSGTGMYLSLLSKLKEASPHIRMVGLTATPFRLDSGLLHAGDDKIFDAIAYEIGIRELIDVGYLSKLRTKKSKVQADCSDLHKRGGEFIAGEIELVMNRFDLIKRAVSEVVKHGEGRTSWLLFCAGIEHTKNVLKELRAQGINAEMVIGSTPSEERARILADFKARKIQALCNCDVLTTGFDAPNIDLIALLRPTCSAGLYVQMVGRGSRLSEGKQDCLLEGTKVLTDRGLVNIEKVSLADKLWDGCSWVNHCGIVFRGERDIINYAGLNATKDHKVWTKEGWRSFGECAEKQIPISVTGNGGNPIQLNCSYFRTCLPQGEPEMGKTCLSQNPMRNLWESRDQGPLYNQKRHSGVSQVWKGKKLGQALLGRAKMASDALRRSKAALYEYIRSGLEEIWWAGYSVQIQIAERHGALDYRQLGASYQKPLYADRSNKQRWPLRASKSTMVNAGAKFSAYVEKINQPTLASIPKAAPGDQICRFNTQEDVGKANISGGSGEILSPFVQTKGRVWDILNAGPFHRFTAQGLLVSNCMILDFAGNIDRFGPLDSISIKTNKGDRAEVKKAPTKTCPSCEEVIHAATLECPSCGFEQVGMREPKHDTKASDADLFQVDKTYAVTYMNVTRHKKEGKPDSVKVAYYMGTLAVYEFLCFDHGGFASEQARKKWREIAMGSIPLSVEEALSRREEVREPSHLTIYKDKGFWRIRQAIYGQKKKDEREGMDINI